MRSQDKPFYDLPANFSNCIFNVTINSAPAAKKQKTIGVECHKNMNEQNRVREDKIVNVCVIVFVTFECVKFFFQKFENTKNILKVCLHLIFWLMF